MTTFSQRRKKKKAAKRRKINRKRLVHLRHTNPENWKESCYVRADKYYGRAA